MGSVPSNAAMVVIMMGRKRTRHASWIAAAGVKMARALSLHREVDHHDAVLLHETHKHDDADKRVETEVGRR